MAVSQLPLEPFREIELPDGTDPVEKGIVRRVCEREGTVTVEVDIDGLGERLAERVVEQVRGTAIALDGAEHVRVEAVRDTGEKLELPTVDRVLAVASAKGGVGKSTVSVGLARALDARGLDVGLFDADIYGPNLPHLLDVEGPILANDSGQPVPLDADGIELLTPGLAGGEIPTARRGVIAYGAVQNLLAHGDWGDLDVLLVDMPAGSDDVAGAALGHVPLDGAVFVTTPFDASVDDTRRTIDLFAEHGVPAVAAVVNMERFVCQCCGEPNALFDDAVDLPVPVVVDLPFDRRLQRDPGRGAVAGVFDDLAATVEAFCAEADADVPDGAVDLRGLPRPSQVRQLADDLAARAPGETVVAVAEDPDWLAAAISAAAGDLVGEVSRPGAAGSTIEIGRA